MIQLDIEALDATLDARACTFDHDTDGPLVRVDGYTDAHGVPHTVAVNYCDVGFRVLDVTEHGMTLVERLAALSDREQQAIAVARDYARQMRLHAAGRRDAHPLPKAKPVAQTDASIEGDGDAVAA